jgi:hypothetical protein
MLDEENNLMTKPPQVFYHLKSVIYQCLSIDIFISFYLKIMAQHHQFDLKSSTDRCTIYYPHPLATEIEQRTSKSTSLDEKDIFNDASAIESLRSLFYIIESARYWLTARHKKKSSHPTRQ